MENKEVKPKGELKGSKVQTVKIHKIRHEGLFTKPIMALIIIGVALIIFNQFQIMSVSALMSGSVHSSSGFFHLTSKSGDKDLSKVDLSGIKSTAQTVGTVFPVEQFKTSDDAMAAMFPTGTPDYGAALGVSFDDPVNSLTKLQNMFNSLKQDVQQNNPEAFKRYVNLASNPYGVSCEYCCGVGPIGADKNGNSRCGCQHNPALLAVTLYLTSHTNYGDAEVLREVMRWKTLFFPKNMIELGMSVAGKDASEISNLPGMVGGC